MKQKITNTSIALFEDKGFSQTSIQDIVDELQVTKGTFYYYFSSKEQLLMDIHLDYITNLLKRQEQIIENKTMLNGDKLGEIIQLLIFDIKEKGPSGRVFFREIRHLAKHNTSIIKEKRDQFRLNIESIVTEGIKTGEFRADLDASMVTFGILGLTNYSYNWFNPEGNVTPEKLVHIYREMILKGISI